MSESGIHQNDEVLRKPSLIAGATKKMALTYVGGTVCATAVVIIDSLIAGVSIGEKALAAIAAAGPLLALDQILHCLFGFGIDKLMIQAIGEGKRKEADRIFGAILIAAVVAFLIVFVPLILFERPLLNLIIADSTLIDMVVDYTVPLFATAAAFEAFLCIERAFRIDGRAKLFSKRAIVTNILNILLDILMVSVFQLGVAGLAWASVISSAIGYTISLSHFFSKKRTVSPDFSVFFNMKEFLSYVKSDIRLGTSATLDEVMDTVALTAQTTTIGVIGGTGGLAIWAVYKSLRGVIQAVGNGVSASVSVHVGLLYGHGDYDGVRYSVKEGTQVALMISLGASFIVMLLADPITVLYGLEPGLQVIGAQCLRIGCVAFPIIVFLLVIASYLPAVDKVRLASHIVLLQYGLTIVPAIFGYTLGLQAFFASYVGAVLAAALVLIAMMVRDRHWFVPERNQKTIAEYSIHLIPSQISAMCIDVREWMAGFGFPASLCSNAAMVVEDCMCLIVQRNPNEVIRADVGFKRHESDVVVTVIDDGAPSNPIVDTAGKGLDKPGTLEAIIVLGFTAEAKYDRVLDLNLVTLVVKPAAATRAGQNKETQDGPSL